MVHRQHTVKPSYYNPGRLFDALMQKMGVNGDKALSRKLNIQISVINSIRSRRLPMAASLLLWIQQETGISIAELRELMGDRRAKFRMPGQMTRPSNT